MKKLLALLFISPLGVPIAWCLYMLISSGSLKISDISLIFAGYLSGLIGATTLGVPFYFALKNYHKEQSLWLVLLGFLSGFLMAFPMVEVGGLEFINLTLMGGVSGFTVALIAWVLINVLKINKPRPLC